MYAKNLTTTANQLKGQAFDSKGALQLLQTLIGSGQSKQQQPAQSAGSDMLGALLGGLTVGGQPQPQQQQAVQPAGSDLFGSLLGGLTGSGNGQTNNNNAVTTNNGLDIGDLLNAGMAYIQAKQSSGSNVSALIQAVVAGSGMGNSNHRQQSTQLVTSSFLQALGALTGIS